ncbi:amidohydrolase family protein [Tautonia plasticadhaerens]|uniref:Imidazolonepropionase n=1 Tax=Tautonia plasticadhaerens TaxID=2527974 RepID=A0A518H124_9BACT|nr:amidohydrolase family protein [Tautonia plasticadhaerens]QDV34537.1 imidazolonepropionase [Tautonia plasticadhaerens]
MTPTWIAPTAALLVLLSAPSSPAQDDARPAEGSETGRLAVLAGKVITCAGDPIVDGIVLVKDGKIEAVGPRAEIEIPEGYQVIDCGDKFLMPGLVEVHCHIGGSGDLNEMVYQTNPDLRVLDQVIPHNEALQVAVAGGVTTVCYIPGSGTNMGGFGAILKTGPGTLDDVLVRFPGVLKIAQWGNPERRDGTLGSGRMGMNWIIRDQLEEGRTYVEAWDKYESGETSERPETDLRLEYFKPLFRREIPVLVHTQGYQGIQATLEMLNDAMNLRFVIGHGTFEGYLISEEINKRGIPVIAGPRGFRYDPDDGQIHGIVAEYDDRGIEWLGVNTDSPVIPQEELFFQAAMAVRYGWDEEEAIRGITIEPARALMIENRVGSIEPGKDADLVICTGSIIDPRNYVTQVIIDGKVAYDIEKDRRRF